MKKILFTILLLINIPAIYALEKDITNDAKIRYKWYQEEKEETYYDKGVPLEGFDEDENKIIYDGDITWNKDFCNNSDNPIIRIVREYKILQSIRYIVINNINYNNNVIILYKGKKYPYTINYQDNSRIIIKFNV